MLCAICAKCNVQKHSEAAVLLQSPQPFCIHSRGASAAEWCIGADLHCAVAAVEDVHALFGIRLVHIQATVIGVVLYRPLAP